MIITRRWLIEALKGIPFALAIIGFFTSLLTKKIPFSIPVSLALILLIVVFYVLAIVWGERIQRQTHRFEKKSREEAAFFLKWYSQDGTLRIYCTDLLWLEDNPKVLNVLCDKSDYLHLYLREYKDYIVERLFKAGAHVYHVKGKVQSSHRFSILNDDGIRSVIIRNKETEETHKVEIQEFRDHVALYNLALDMLEDCFDKVYHRSTHQTID